MKTATTKRKAIVDAVELLKEESPNAPGNIAGVQLIPLEKVRAFKDHPFRLYEGERLDDMVQSIRDHGILNPVIVRKVYGGYEMLAGHNRLNAAQIAGMTEVPAIVKTDLSDEEAYVYVIETNVIQRSFTDLAPSEKAAVLSARYEKVISQGKRNDILREIEEIGTCGHDVHKSKSRDGIGEEYGMTGRNIARYMRVDKLIRPFKDRLDAGDLTLTAAVELSYLSEVEQEAVAAQDVKMDEKTAKAVRAASGELTEGKLEENLRLAKAPAPAKMVIVKIPVEAEEKYFSGLKAKDRADLVMQALEAWFAGKEAAYVQ